MRAYLRGPSVGPLHTTLWSSKRRRKGSGKGTALAFAVALVIVLSIKFWFVVLPTVFLLLVNAGYQRSRAQKRLAAERERQEALSHTWGPDNDLPVS